MLRHATTRTAGNRTAPPGFTVIELLVLTVIIGLLSALMIPSLLGQREKAEGATAQSLLRTGAGTLESAAVDTDGYAAITTARLGAIEPNIAWRDTAGATTAANAISVSGLSADGYTLTTTTNDGRIFTLVKDLTAVPTITRACGPGCTW